VLARGAGAALLRQAMANFRASLPIDEVLGEISARLREGSRLVLAAPPGAGKTTRVPLSLAGFLDEPAVVTGRILMLEPRREKPWRTAGKARGPDDESGPQGFG